MSRGFGTDRLACLQRTADFTAAQGPTAAEFERWFALRGWRLTASALHDLLHRQPSALCCYTWGDIGEVLHTPSTKFGHVQEPLAGAGYQAVSGSAVFAGYLAACSQIPILAASTDSMTREEGRLAFDTVNLVVEMHDGVAVPVSRTLEFKFKLDGTVNVAEMKPIGPAEPPASFADFQKQLLRTPSLVSRLVEYKSHLGAAPAVRAPTPHRTYCQVIGRVPVRRVCVPVYLWCCNPPPLAVWFVAHARA